MSAPINFSNGYGGTLGAEMATRSPILATGACWYVSSSGSDAYAGTDRTKPFATLATAYTAASAGDTIILLAGHTQTITVAVTLAKTGLRIRGEGSGTNRPTLSCGAAIAMLDITAAGVWIENIYFPASSAAPTARIRTAAAASRIRNCYLECGASDTAASIKLVTGAGTCRIEDTTLVSVATDVTAQPAIGIEIANAASDVDLKSVVFDGGTTGWSDFALKGTAAITRLYGVDVSFLNDSDYSFATGTSGELHISNRSGGSRGVWTP